jgi:nitrous oxidase accessory protein
MRLCILLIAYFCSLNAFSKVIRVGKDMPEKSIKNAISKAAGKDTIEIYPGIYKEGNIVVDKEVCIRGIGYPVLDGEKKHEILSVKSDRVCIEGLHLQHSGAGTLDDPGAIKVYDSDLVTIQNNILEDNFFGIYIQYGKKCLIKGNRIRAYGTEEQEIGNGIHCWKSDSLLIVANRISGHRDGIYFEFVTHSVIWRNISVSNIRYGLHFMFSNNDAYITNVFRKNGAGVAVMFTKGVTMINNTFEENWGDASYGLLLKEISDSYIYGNKFIRNTSAVYMEGASRILFEHNVVHANGWGMKVQASCMDNDIIANNFTSNTFDMSTNGTLVLNNFKGNYWDKYEGYDLNNDGKGDVPFHPLSLFSVIVENNPAAMLLFRSFIVSMIDRSEKLIPSLTPENFRDDEPVMKALQL